MWWSPKIQCMRGGGWLDDDFGGLFLGLLSELVVVVDLGLVLVFADD